MEEETEEKHGNTLQKQKEADKKRIGANCPVQVSLVDMMSNELKLNQGIFRLDVCYRLSNSKEQWKYGTDHSGKHQSS